MLLWPGPCLCQHQYPCYGGFPWKMAATSARITRPFPLFLLLDYSFSLQYWKNTTLGDEWNRSPFFLCFPFHVRFFAQLAVVLLVLTRLLPCRTLNFFFKGPEWALTM